MHVGSVAIFQPSENGFDYDRLVTLIGNRIALAPRFRQRVRWVPGNLANPVWVDDESFDITYHVRRSALPSPGTEAQLRELVGRIMSRSLDRTRPLWELYLVEGLEGGRFALLGKTHHAMIDSSEAVDIGQVILDVEPDQNVMVSDEWAPLREPTGVELMVNAVSDFVRSPTEAVDHVRFGISDVNKSVVNLGKNMFGIASAAVTAARATTASPLNVEIGKQRRYGMAHLTLDELKEIRRDKGGTVNDVVLTIVAGALRSWLLTRGESVGVRTVVRAMVPVSVQVDAEVSGAVSPAGVAEFLIDLPVGEPDPVVRLQRISFDMAQHKESSRMLGAEAIMAAAEFAPPTLHSMGARLGSGIGQKVFNLMITNVPGPQQPLYLNGSEMTSSYPVVPLVKSQAVSIGLTSYNGGVYFGLNSDRDAMPDIEVLAQCIADSAEELRNYAKPIRRANPSKVAERHAATRRPKRAAKSSTSASAPAKATAKNAATKSAAKKAVPKKTAAKKPSAKK